jgi:hypothetical protein
MGIGISGNYDGEGPNVAPQTATAPGPVAGSPDVWAKRGSMNNGITGGQGIGGFAPVDRRGRLRTSSESARSGTAISIGGGDQVLTVCTRALYVGGGGNLVCRLADDTADITLTGLVAGVVYPIAIALVRATGTTATGILLF